MNPWRGLGLAHPEHTPMEQLRGILREVDQNAQQAIFRRRQRAVLISRIASRQPAPPMQSPFGHIVQKRRLKVGYQRSKLLHSQARQISHVGRMRGKIAIP